MTTLETLREARKVIEQGWCRGVFFDDMGNFCLVGALSTKASRTGQMWARAYTTPEFDGPLGALREVIFGDTAGPRSLTYEEKVAIALWNNADDRTKQDILSALDAAIAKQEKCQQENAIVPA